MFAAFVITLRPTSSAVIGNSTGRSLHGLFFKMLEQQDPALAAQAHADNEIKAMTVSPLRGRLRREGERNIVLPDQLYRVRYTTLSDGLFNALSKILLGKFLYRERVMIDEAEFAVQDVTVESAASRGWGRLASAQEVWNNTKSQSEVTLRFASPTTFRQNKLNLVFPVPKNVFHSYRERWNAFTLYPIDDEFVSWVEQNVAVTAHHLQTRQVWHSDFALHGFVGWARFIAKDRDMRRLKEWNALADFSFFSGTGQKTTQGMGQTRRLEGNFEHSSQDETE
ncbi:MAG: CRISPR-associated endoribonuclease Cas6 [Chloroflexota bacterium]|nr:MAG: CRISPR-associated endoribonuclease Cas6 [Chloroflexota bacterium]